MIGLGIVLLKPITPNFKYTSYLRSDHRSAFFWYLFTDPVYNNYL